jgi:hypothetical protein
MTIYLPKEPTSYSDTRGLPDGMDTEQLFRYRYDTVVKDAVGFESFLYKLIPYQYVKSFAFAIDPTYRFKVAPSTITAANRTKYRATDSVTLQRKWTRSVSFRSWSQLSNYKGVAVCSSPYLVYTSSSNPAQSGSLSSQPPLPDILKDTTKRTRLPGSSQGELEFFKASSNSPPRTSLYVVNGRRTVSGNTVGPSCSEVGGVPDYEVGSTETWLTNIFPSAATLSKSTYDSLRASELSLCRGESARNLVPMLKGISPYSRQYSLSRNVAELKDLPRSVLQLQQTARDLHRVYSSLAGSPKLRSQLFDNVSTAASNLPGEYLSYHFGWKQLHKDLSDLLTLPEKISKKLNFLISRSGKATTFRSKRNSLGSGTGVSGYVYDVFDHEWEPTHNSRIVREYETRLVVNAIFDFPPINTPHLRSRFIYDQVGLIPRFIDVYNIIPWTWLVDWFTGLGNYLELIEEVNHDPSLINWGIITTNCSGKLITEFTYINATQNDFYHNNVRISPTAAENMLKRHTSVLEFECQTRQNVASVLSVERTTVPESLSGYRLSILGALLAQRIDNTRPGSFRPRS